MYVMTEELKAQWIAALRSGEYNQTRSALKNNEGFCCLGVLCDVIDNTRWADDNQTNGYNFELGDTRFSFNTAVIPSEAAKPLALNKMLVTIDDNIIDPDQIDLEVDSHDTTRLDDYLITLNDNGKSFSEIADIIEKHLTVPQT